MNTLINPLSGIPAVSTPSKNERQKVGVFKVAMVALLTGAALLLNACGGVTTPETPGSAAETGIRALPAAFLTTKAVAYSPYRTAKTEPQRASEVITDEQVKEDLDLLVKAGIGLIRIFDSSDKVAARTLRVIAANNMDIKVMLGIYVGTFEYITNPTQRANVMAANEAEIARGVSLAKAYPNQVVAVSVGNETMVVWSFVPISTSTMAQYIKSVRNQITQPVTTDDNWAFYAGQGRNAYEQAAEVMSQIDFASVHTYPMEDMLYSNFDDKDLNPDWDWQQTGVTDTSKRAKAMMDAAIAKATKDYAAVRTYLDRTGREKMPIIIGETGWRGMDPTEDGRYKFLAHPANQQMYYQGLLDWVNASRANGNGPKAIVYFEAFDEPWKQADDGWGLFTVDRKARCAAQSLSPSATWAKDTSKSCDASAAVYFNPPKQNSAVLGPQMVIHTEAVTGWPGGMRADAYQGGTFTLGYPLTGDSAPSDMAATLAASRYISLSNFNNSAGYGWGLLWQSSASPALTANMSNFANGSIRFSIKTAYAGSLRIGISSDTELGSGTEAFVLVSDGKYGYCRTGTQWCDVTIPLSAFKAANPKLDLRYVLTRFSISDVWDATGNTARTGMPEIRLDNIYWQQ